jgi:3-phenylpropionate/cinnamic acid dioxygenase small subunit
MATAITRHEAEDFLFHEARLLDEGRFEDWLRLFAKDGTYWIPLDEYADPKHEPSILYDDGPGREWRVHQLLHQPHYSQMPRSRTVHFISNVQVEPEQANGAAVVRCNLCVTELRSSGTRAEQYGLGQQRDVVGRCLYHLRWEDGRWAIALKKVALIDHDMPIVNLTFVI